MCSVNSNPTCSSGRNIFREVVGNPEFSGSREDALASLEADLGDSFDPSSVEKYSDADLKSYAARSKAFQAHVDSLPAAEQMPFLNEVRDNLGERIDAARAQLQERYPDAGKDVEFPRSNHPVNIFGFQFG